jgi:hypothetical protein
MPKKVSAEKRFAVWGNRFFQGVVLEKFFFKNTG